MMLDNSPMIDVAIGLIFFYVTLSLVCSSIQEIIAGLCGLRSRNLKKGIRNLVGNEYAQALYDHPLIKGLRKPTGGHPTSTVREPVRRWRSMPAGRRRAWRRTRASTGVCCSWSLPCLCGW